MKRNHGTWWNNNVEIIPNLHVKSTCHKQFLQWWGLPGQFLPFRYFQIIVMSKETLAIEYHVYIGRCHRSSAAVTPFKYECDSNNLTCTFTISKILLTEKLTNGTLVTPTPGLLRLFQSNASEGCTIPCLYWILITVWHLASNRCYQKVWPHLIWQQKCTSSYRHIESWKWGFITINQNFKPFQQIVKYIAESSQVQIIHNPNKYTLNKARIEHTIIMWVLAWIRYPI